MKQLLNTQQVLLTCVQMSAVVTEEGKQLVGFTLTDEFETDGVSHEVLDVIIRAWADACNVDGASLSEEQSESGICYSYVGDDKCLVDNFINQFPQDDISMFLTTLNMRMTTYLNDGQQSVIGIDVPWTGIELGNKLDNIITYIQNIEYNVFPGIHITNAYVESDVLYISMEHPIQAVNQCTILGVLSQIFRPENILDEDGLGKLINEGFFQRFSPPAGEDVRLIDMTPVLYDLVPGMSIVDLDTYHDTYTIMYLPELQVAAEVLTESEHLYGASHYEAYVAPGCICKFMVVKQPTADNFGEYVTQLVNVLRDLDVNVPDMWLDI